MFVDELTIEAKAGDGGDGVVRWRHERHKPKAGPAGGNGGNGGDVFMRAVRDLGLLSKYTGAKEFRAENGAPGQKNSMHGKGGEDKYIDVPVGAKVTDQKSGRVFTFEKEGEIYKILNGGEGGLGNEYFKSSTNRAPKEWTPGKKGEASIFQIELALVVDVGLTGFPNAGKSTLINTITNTKSRVGSYPFTTVEPYLGELYGFILADIPGLIEGASEGKGLGHKFLRHITRTKMILHVISLEHEDVVRAYETIRNELEKYDPELLLKDEWVILSKSDLVDPKKINKNRAELLERNPNTFVVSAESGEGIDALRTNLVHFLEKKT